MQLKKIKIKQNEVDIAYEIEMNTSDFKEVKYRSFDKPLPSFYEAFDALKQDVIMILELPDDYEKDLLVQSVAFSYGGEDKVMGAVITALKKVSTANSPATLNTPHLGVASYSSSSNGLPVFSGATGNRLYALKDEAIKYLDGDRAEKQQTLFEPDKKTLESFSKLVPKGVDSVTISSKGMSSKKITREDAKKAEKLAKTL